MECPSTVESDRRSAGFSGARAAGQMPIEERSRVTKLSVLTLAVLITLGVPFQVSADASPPLYPPGSALLPAGETMVQMVAETVEINIAPTGARADYEARFTMRNWGEATELMDVRFPLTDGNSWETIWDF